MSEKQIWNTPKARKTLIFYTVLLLVLLIPVFVVGLYARPVGDDLSGSALTHAAVQQGGNLGDILSAAWATNVQNYMNWQGIYTSAFLLALIPSIFGGHWYGVCAFLIAVPLFICLWISARMLLRRLFPDGMYLALPITALLTFAFLEGLPDPCEGLYWLNGAMHYTFFFTLAIVNVTIAFALIWDEKKKIRHVVLGCLLAAFIGGGHRRLSTSMG